SYFYKSHLLFCLDLPESASEEIIYQGDINSTHIYFTFDDGHSYKNTRDILDILKEKNVPATFFIEGDFLVQNPILINRIVNEQTLGNHTMCHKDITQLSNQQFRDDIAKYEKAVLEITGHSVTKYFRPPMGRINKSKQAILNELGYSIFKWDVSYYDYVYFDDRGVDYALNNILKQTKNGSIILMHTLTKSNVKVLGTAIDKLREKGFVFSDLSELV
ncbi:MAG: polysaccharide deacetylase family protein, partial [Anaeroplasmataceae bacterium]|nr:polysaccharide deacetylase family protein [Anaeroplasmataceae bacterium]